MRQVVGVVKQRIIVNALRASTTDRVCIIYISYYNECSWGLSVCLFTKNFRTTHCQMIKFGTNVHLPSGTNVMEKLITYSESSIFSLSISVFIVWGFTGKLGRKIELKFIGISIFASISCRIWLG